ncbi:S-layer homology domain-containing protein [Phosphitispora sp. TUW77]|uniref:S-layer homology domain-containing protein n=1 Tax=Phosphitispora sp. TUW77 TaxID=3152361 RepID=UPI003AB583AF
MKKPAAVVLIAIVLGALFYMPVKANKTDYLTGDFYDLMDRNGSMHWAYEEMTELIAMGIVQGYTETVYDRNTGRYLQVQTAQPYKKITRAEFAKILYEALSFKPVDTKAAFNDRIPSWAENAVNSLYANGIVKGNPDGTFQADRQISRAEITVMLVRAIANEQDEQDVYENIEPDVNTESTFSDVTTGYWAYPSIQKASEIGLITGFPDGRFAPGQGAKRAEVIVMLYRYLMNDKSNLPSNRILLSQSNKVSNGIESLVNGNSSTVIENLMPYLTGEIAAYISDAETMKMFEAMNQGEHLSYEITSRGRVINKSSYWAEVVYDSLASFRKDDIYVEADMPIHYYLMKTGDKWQVYKESYESDSD